MLVRDSTVLPQLLQYSGELKLVSTTGSDRSDIGDSIYWQMQQFDVHRCGGIDVAYFFFRYTPAMYQCEILE